MCRDGAVNPAAAGLVAKLLRNFALPLVRAQGIAAESPVFGAERQKCARRRALPLTEISMIDNS
jgi:hypothetical protein